MAVPPEEVKGLSVPGFPYHKLTNHRFVFALDSL